MASLSEAVYPQSWNGPPQISFSTGSLSEEAAADSVAKSDTAEILNRRIEKASPSPSAWLLPIRFHKLKHWQQEGGSFATPSLAAHHPVATIDGGWNGLCLYRRRLGKTQVFNSRQQWRGQTHARERAVCLFSHFYPQ